MQHEFVDGLNAILLIAAFVSFVGAVLGFALVRRQDFVASGPQQEQAAARGRLTRGQLPRGEQQDHRRARHDDERLSGDRERDRVRLRHAGHREQRAPAPACIAAPAGPIGSAADAADAQRKPSASAIRALHRQRVQEQEDGGPAQRPRDRDQEERRDRLARALRVLGEPAAERGSA